MFKNEYQGGPFVEIFSAQGKDPIAKWKLYGSPSAISKGFDKEVKGFVFVLEGSSQTNKMQLPKENKQMLGLIQRFLILQLYIPLGQDFSAELLVTDLANIKRRLYLSTVHRELSATPLHAKIPLFLLNRKIWCNLCIDLVSFTSGIFKGAAFQSLDGIIISANCKLRKIFTMKLKPQDSGEESDINRPRLSSIEPTDEIPRCCQITTDVHQVTQVLDFTKLNQYETKHDGRPLASSDTDQIASKGQGSSRSNKTQDKAHIAFGSKVSGPPPATCRKMSSKLSAQTTRSTNRPDRSLNQQPCGAGDRTVLPTERRESLPSATHCLDQKNKEHIHQTRKKEITLHGYQPHPPSESPTSERINSLKGVGRIEKEMNKLSTVASSLGYCKNEDKLCVQIRMPSCERLNSAQTLNNSTVLQESTNLTDDWIFPDSFQDDTSKLSATQHQTDINNVSVELADSNKNDSTNQRKTLAGDHDEILTYCSSPRTTPHGKFHSYPLDLKIVSLDSREPDSRGARMEDDFYGSDSSIEEAQHGFFQRASSPKFCHSNLQLSKPSQSFQSTDLGLHNTHRSMENILTEDSLTNTPKEMTSSSSHILPIKTMNYESIQKNLMPTRSLSPDGSRPEISREDPIISKIQQVISIDNLRSSINKTILKEIPKEDRRFTADAHSYDWRNYQLNRLSASEMQMLASLKRQQNEELEDYGTVHMLSQSQIDHCNVTISTSSDETTTWSSCLPPPVNQGRHYQEEMNPLTHSNPRDWLKAFSPPIMPTIQSRDNMEHFSKLKQSSTNSCNEGDDGLGAEEDEVLTLFYDPCLNCYFDPDTGKYYELA